MVRESKKPDISKIDTTKLKRTQHADDNGATSDFAPPVSAGAVDKVVDYAFNPSREKIREMTVIDRVQGRLLPQLDLVNMIGEYVIEIATYRQDSNAYEKKYKRKQPIPPNLIDEFTYRTAQWQKSVAGKNLERATDIALAETEVKGGGDEFRNADTWED